MSARKSGWAIAALVFRCSSPPPEAGSQVLSFPWSDAGLLGRDALPLDARSKGAIRRLLERRSAKLPR